MCSKFIYISLFFGIIYLGFISIDCGATEDYLDDGTGIFYKSDAGFIDTGTNSNISPENQYSNQYYGRQMRNLRSFPQGEKNCYTLKPERSEEHTSELQSLHVISYAVFCL